MPSHQGLMDSPGLTKADIYIRLEEIDGCWVWTGARNGNGYGQVRFNGRAHTTHVLLWELERGERPEGMDLDHLCGNKACCNPDHLEPVSRAENVKRAWRRIQTCAQGHVLTCPTCT